MCSNPFRNDIFGSYSTIMPGECPLKTSLGIHLACIMNILHPVQIHKHGVIKRSVVPCCAIPSSP